MQHKDPQSRLPDPSSDLTPQSEENARKVPPKPSYEAAYGHLRNGQIYPDPFPYDPPSPEESDSLNLTPPQRIALEHILLGSQLSVAARVAGVTRMTLYRWFHHDPNFQAAYNTWQADAILNSRTRFLAMTNTATSTLECAVQSDPRIALAVLKATGILQPAIAGPTEPEECRRQIDLNQQQSQPQPQPQPQPAGATVHAPSGALGETFSQRPAENGANGTKHVELHARQQENNELPSPCNESPRNEPPAIDRQQQITGNQPTSANQPSDGSSEPMNPRMHQVHPGFAWDSGARSVRCNIL